MTNNASPGRTENQPSWLSIEAGLLAGLTILLYLTAGAYQLGYQDQFDFTYISLGIEDLVGSSRTFLIPLVIAFTCSVTGALAASVVVKRPRNTIFTLAVSAFPIVLTLTLAIMYANPVDFWRVDRATWVFLGLFYVFEAAISVPAGRRWRARIGKRIAGIRTIQGLVTTVLVVLLAYDMGVIEASHQRRYELCSTPGVTSVVVQVADDVIVCAEADLTAKLVYSRFFYLKIGEGEAPVSLRIIEFQPKQIGVPRGDIPSNP
jgi:hypothetical protein